MQIKNAVILLDEMGLYAPSAQSWTLPPEAFNAVANNRKRAQHIIYAAQYPSQVHSSIHQICSDILYAEGVAVWDNELRNERLLFKDVHLFQPSEFEVWFRDPKVRKNPVKVWVLATKHWKGIINCHDAQTFYTYDSFGLLEEQDLETSKFAKKSDFGYYPYVIDSGSTVELSSSDLMESGRTFAEIEEILDTHYKADRFKKKRIYEASGNYPFVAWKLQGEISFPGPHYFQKQIMFLWNVLPAASHKGLNRLDLRITRECLTWQKFDKVTKDSYKVTWNIFVGFVLWVLLLIFLPKHFILFLAVTVISFSLPFRIFK
ncbi:MULTISPECIES: zonular occludens toxin domain-containing protein [unclassified Microcoleus]|uniref:zonular occludens toxin domain-containing protein n=1 Tax=unclassified Microcoleus TaxID=2642155 RepID=UPI002FD699C4